MQREIVRIDEDLCDGCGECVPSCHEGALQIIDGKARLVSDQLCDGLGACLGTCPRGAIRVERREAEPFSEAAVMGIRTAAAAPEALRYLPHAPSHAPSGGCPSTQLRQLKVASRPSTDPISASTRESQLTHWPVKLRLLSPDAPVLRGAHLLVAADCVPVALPDFQQRMLRGRAVVIGCPKFDDLEEYVERLTAILAHSGLAEVTVARMVVPCCRGITMAVLEAHRRARSSVPVTELVVDPQGDVVGRSCGATAA